MPSRKKKTTPYQQETLVFLGALVPVMLVVIGLVLTLTKHDFSRQKAPEAPEAQEPTFIIQHLNYPDWFRSSNLDLREDLRHAQDQGKLGLAVYFGRENCACCDVMMEVNLHAPDIMDYMQANFDVIAIDTTGANLVTTFDGQEMPEARFAREQQAAATPSILFYDTHGKLMYHLLGYYPRYEFRAALDYVVGRKYNSLAFSQYLKTLGRPVLFSAYELHDSPLFLEPPFDLNRSEQPGERPLAVFFERGSCPGCDFFHGRKMRDPIIAEELAKMDLVQLDMDDDTPVVKPDGTATTAAQWAKDLEITYSPAFIFFDRDGAEISAIRSVAQWDHLPRYLKYVINGVYRNANRDH